MSGISSGIGLISGIDSAGLIDQLIALDSVPIQVLESRSTQIDLQKAAFLQVSARLSALQNSVLLFSEPSFFQQFTAASSNEGVVSASASASAAPGTYAFRVLSLVSSHALVTRGFADSDTTPVGAGTLTFEVANGQVNGGTDLASLHGGAGVRRGTFTITDRAGNTADVDISTALTITDVVNAINAAGVNVRARVTGITETVDGATVTGDRIVIEDVSNPGADGTFASHLIIEDVFGAFAAADLGIVADVAGGRIDGSDLVRLSEDTPLSLLNDGNGVGRAALGLDDDMTFTMAADVGSFNVRLSDLLDGEMGLDMLNSGNGVRSGTIRITDRSGASADIVIDGSSPDGVHTLQDVLDAIQAKVDAGEVSVSATLSGSRIVVTDTSGASGDTAVALKIEDVAGADGVAGFAAADLGIAQEAESDTITGADIYRVATVGDVLRAINLAPGNVATGGLVTASIAADGNGLAVAVAGDVFGNTLTITAVGESTAADDLGLLDASVQASDPPFETRALVAGLDTVLLRSLNGGSGVAVGSVVFGVAGQLPVSVDFSGARTLADVVDMINGNMELPVVASVNAAGTGIELRGETDGGAPVLIESITGALADDLGISGTFGPDDLGPDGVVRSGNLQVQYISRNTLLADLNAGRGVDLGSIRITDTTGATTVIDVPATSTTVGDVLDAINLLGPSHIEARINDTGDGIMMVDTAGGDGTLMIDDVGGGTTASDLRLAGSAAAGQNFIDGTYEVRIDIDATDTLDDIAQKINDAGGDFSASVINGGGGVNPFSLAITAGITGANGRLVVDGGGLDLGLETMTEARDAVATFGGSLVSSSSNTLDNLIPGVTVNLLSASDDEVTLTVEQDIDGIVGQIESFVSAYNDAQSEINTQTSFDPDTLARGTLFGDATVELVRTRLARLMLRGFDDAGAGVSRLSQIGLTIGGNRELSFDAARFRDVLAAQTDDVEQLFTQADTGFGDVATATLDDLTRDFDGVLARKNNLLSDQQAVLADRIEQLNALLDAKRARLEAQFAALEASLANLQDQQTSLGSLSLLLAPQA